MLKLETKRMKNRIKENDDITTLNQAIVLDNRIKRN